MDQWRDGWINNGWMHESMDERKKEWINWQKIEMNGWINKWMN